MPISYSDTHDFTAEQLQALFLSVEWESGKHPDKLVTAMKNYATVFSAWDGDKLIGLVSAMDDGILTAYVHYLLVNPSYQKQGIGKHLMTLIQSHYAAYLKLILVAENHAVEFYKSCGFKQVQAVPMSISKL